MDWKHKLERVVSFGEEKVTIPRIKLKDVVEYVDNLVSTNSDGETTGYEASFYIWWNVGEDKFVLTGDLWYADEWTFKRGDN